LVCVFLLPLFFVFTNLKSSPGIPTNKYCKIRIPKLLKKHSLCQWNVWTPVILRYNMYKLLKWWRTTFVCSIMYTQVVLFPIAVIF
jgi:hypothetical protein